MGAKYNIAIGMSGLKQAVSGINSVRTAETRRRAALNEIAATQAKVNQLQREGASTKWAKRKLDFLKAETRELDKQIRKLNKQKSLKGMFGGLGGGIKGMLGGMLAGFGIHQAGSAARGAMADAGKLTKQAGTIGVDSEFLQEFQFGAEQNSMSGDQASMGLQRFARRLAQAQAGGGELLPELEKMGIALTDTAGNARSTKDVLRDYANGVSEIEDPQKRLLAGFKAFDSEGAALINIMKDGAAGMDAYAQQARKAGAVMSNSVVDRLADADAKFVQWGKTLKVWTANVVAEYLPTFMKVKDAFADFFTFIRINGQFLSNLAGNLMNGQGFDESLSSARGIMAKEIRLAENRQRNRAANRTAENSRPIPVQLATGEASREIAKEIGTSVAEKVGKVSKSVDALAQIGGVRGRNGALAEQSRRMAAQEKAQREANQHLQRIDRNTQSLR